MTLLAFMANVISTTGTIKFDVNNDGNPEMILNTNGLGLNGGQTPASLGRSLEV